MPKKPPKNAYFFFMLDYKSREEKYGRRFHDGLKSVALAASEEWKCLPQHKKEYYNKIAKARKSDPRPNIRKPEDTIFNHQGESSTQIRRKTDENEKKFIKVNQFAENFVNEMNFEMLQNRMLYLIHVNYFCKTDDDIYYPAELAIVKFTLKHGARGIFHRYIDPGEIAIGYSFTIKEHSELFHKIPLAFVKSIDNASNMPRMYSEICEFLREHEPDGNIIPPLFTMYDDILCNTSITAVKKTLKRLWEVTNSQDDGNSWEKIKVYPLPPMFCRLKNKCYSFIDPHSKKYFSSALAEKELQKETYNFDIKTACNFHQSEDAIPMCSKSYVLRWSFLIRDSCCQYLGIDVFGQHENFDEMFLKSGDSAYGNHKDDDRKSVLTDFPAYSEDNQIFNINQRIKEEKDIKKEDSHTSQSIKEEKEGYGGQPIKKEKEDCSSQAVKKEEEDYRNQSIMKEEDDCSDRSIEKGKEDYFTQTIKEEKKDYNDQFMKKEKENSCDGPMKRKNEDYSCQVIKKEKMDNYGDPKIKEENVFDPTKIKIMEEKNFDFEPETGQSANSCSIAWSHEKVKEETASSCNDYDFLTSGGNEKMKKMEIKQEKIEPVTEDY